MTPNDAGARWAAFCLAHPDAEIVVPPGTWLERVRARLPGSKLWTLRQLERKLALPPGWRVKLSANGQDVRIWMAG